MRTVLVPLDGNETSESILPEAIRVAGKGGRILLMRDVSSGRGGDGFISADMEAVESSDRYLRDRARQVESAGVSVGTETFVLQDPAMAIDEAADMLGVDLIACATHGRSGVRRVFRPSVAWAALAKSSVPVMVQRSRKGPTEMREAVLPVKILVPLDGSKRSEESLPLAVELAKDWNGQLLLVQVLPYMAGPGDSKGYLARITSKAEEYLNHVATSIAFPTSREVVAGDVLSGLADTINSRAITHVVMSSHGRTGLRRVATGSVTDDLIRRVAIPIVVVPSFSTSHKARVMEAVPLRSLQPAL